MEQYKLINAQLMDQVQSQRKMIGQMREEEVLLKKQWMEERERRLADAQYNEMKLKYAIKTLLNNLDINVDLNISSSSTKTSHTTETGKNSTSNSNRICSEFRRSSVLLPRSVPISPTSRRSSSLDRVESSKEVTNDTGTEEETTVIKTPEPRRLVELQEYSPDSPEAIEEKAETAEEATLMSPPGIACGNIYSIIEESDAEGDGDCDVTSSSVCSSADTQQLRVIGGDTKKASPLPLRDLTNKTIRSTASPKNTKARSNSTLLAQNETENDMQESIIGKVKRAPSKQAMRGRGKSTDCASLEVSIEHVRHATRQSSPIQLTVPSMAVNLTPDPSPRRSQLNFERFNGIILRPADCSTPRQDPDTRNTKHKGGVSTIKSKSNSVPEITERFSNETTLTGRPSRSCRPKSLKEPSLTTKMRNESLGKPK